MKKYLQHKFNFLLRYLPSEDEFNGQKAYMNKFLPENSIILEAGAHIGKDTFHMARHWPKGTVHAFEPVPNIYKSLVKNTKGLKNVITHQLALSDKNGFSTIFVSEGASDASSSILKPKVHLETHPNVTFEKEISIEALTLDDWAKKNNISKLDFLWLDMQGHELSVLKQGTEILKTVKAIYTEVNMVESYAGGALYPELRAWLEAQGFKVEVEELWWKEAGNVFFVRN